MKTIFFKREVHQTEATISYVCVGGTVRQQGGSVQLTNEKQAERFFTEQRMRLAHRLGPPDSDQFDPDNPHLRKMEATLDYELKRLAYWTTRNGGYVLMITLDKGKSWRVELLHN